MAIQAQILPDTSGFPFCHPPEWSTGGIYEESWSNIQRQQLLLTAPHMQQFHLQSETPSSSISQMNTQFVNLHETLSFDSVLVEQNKRLRHVLREQMKRDVTELLRKFEMRTIFLLNQKDEEILKAKSRTSQLESLLVTLQADCLTWQQMVKQNEVHVMSLSNTIQLLQQQQCEPVVEDTESCCDEHKQQSGNFGRMVCRACRMREVGVVVLPCRHLCLCSVCDPMIDLCPVCQTVKNGSIEALVH